LDPIPAAIGEKEGTSKNKKINPSRKKKFFMIFNSIYYTTPLPQGERLGEGIISIFHPSLPLPSREGYGHE
jgi:sialic acid synthase SpsE